MSQFIRQFRFGLGGSECSHIFHDWEKVGILHAQEILPEKIADAEQTRQRIQYIRFFDGGDLIVPVGTLEELGEKFAEMKQRCRWIGRVRQKMREMLDQQNGSAEFAL